MLVTMLESEVDAFVEEHTVARDENGHRQVVRNGRLPSREVMTTSGPIEVAQPRVRDRRGVDDKDAVRFTCKRPANPMVAFVCRI